MTTLIDYILDLFRSPNLAAPSSPTRTAMRDAGLPNVTAAQLRRSPPPPPRPGSPSAAGTRCSACSARSPTTTASPFAPMSRRTTFAPQTDMRQPQRPEPTTSP